MKYYLYTGSICSGTVVYRNMTVNESVRAFTHVLKVSCQKPHDTDPSLCA